MKKRKIINVLVLLAAVGMMFYAELQLIKLEQVYQRGHAAYNTLSEQVKSLSAGVPIHMPQEVTIGEQQDYITLLQIDFETLITINEDTVAWLYCPGTEIDYPIMKADDYNYYLHHLPGGTQNANGSLFIDYNCAPDFSDLLTVIYGHNMKSKMMFGSLVEYKSQRYYDEHPYMYLYTQQENYRIEILYGCVIDAGQWRDRAFMYAENVDALLAYAAHNTTFESSAIYAGGDKVIAMSTCSYEFDDARYVVIGILR